MKRLVAIMVLLSLPLLVHAAWGQQRQVTLDAKLITVSRADTREVSFDMLGSVWGKSQPKVGEQVWDGTGEYVSVLVSQPDGESFRKALADRIEFDVWRLVLRNVQSGRGRECVLQAPKIVTFNYRAASSLVIASGDVTCSIKDV